MLNLCSPVTSEQQNRYVLHMIREVLGWCAVLNAGLLLLAALAVITVGGPVKRIHGALLGLSDEDLSRAYFQYLAQYKLAILIFNAVPYVALRIVE